jgi:hypothetical protein
VHASAEDAATLNLPAAQAATLDPDPVYPAFATQAAKAVEPVAPPVAELEGQPVHAASPVAALKLPAEQAVGVPPSGPVYPAFATQAVTAVEPVEPSVAELEGQPVHAVSPVSALKVPAKQAVEAPPLEPVYPAFATHSLTAVDAVAPPVAELSGHDLQTADE